MAVLDVLQVSLRLQQRLNVKANLLVDLGLYTEQWVGRTMRKKKAGNEGGPW